MSREARRGRGLLIAALAMALGLLAGLPSIAAAETKVVTVKADLVAQDKVNPTNDLQCSALGFIKWRDPRFDVPKEIPIAWEIFYTQNGEERSLTAEPPFSDSTKVFDSVYLVGGGAHWVNISLNTKVGAGAADGCSDMTENILRIFEGPARVEITVDLKEPPIDQKKCKKARAELRERNKAVGKLRGKLRRADSSDAKDRLREKLAKAKDKRADAAQKVAKVCT